MGKPQLSRVLEFGPALEGVARVMEFGDEKYGRYNWQAGQPYTKCIDSLMRHLTQFMAGEDTDRESSMAHVDHVVVNALMLAFYVHALPEMDDRPTSDAMRGR